MLHKAIPKCGRTRIAFDGGLIAPLSLWSGAMSAIGPSAMLQIDVTPVACDRIARAAEFVDRIARRNKPVYGINTGVGHFANVVIPPDKIAALQTHLIRSHCCGVGAPLPRDIVMAMWLIRLNTICQGHSGTRLETVETIARHLEAGLLAEVPSRGSVGASGDLAPSAHATRALLGEGWCTLPDRRHVGNGHATGGFLRLRAADALQQLGIEPVRLGPKEGLSLINGTQLTTALLLKAWYEGRQLLATANLAAALSFEAMHGAHQALDDRALRLHGHEGTRQCGQEIRRWLAGDSEIQHSYAGTKWAQDPYCLRCAPQVHGAVWEDLRECERVVNTKINAVADNPLLFPEEEEALSCGNFHAIHSARASDRLASALTTLASISERRINMAMNHHRSGLPSFLIEDGGVQSGLMMTQVTAAALVSECKSLSFPASVDSIPTNNDQEDHVSMGPNAGFKALAILEKARLVLAIELLTAAQALELRAPLRPAQRLAVVHQQIRRDVAFLDVDRALSEDIERLAQRIEEGVYLTPWPPQPPHLSFEPPAEASEPVEPGLLRPPIG